MGSAGAARRESGAESCWCSCWWSRWPETATMTVANLLMPVAGLIKARYRGAKADIDSPFFKLHYRTTASQIDIRRQKQNSFRQIRSNFSQKTFNHGSYKKLKHKRTKKW